MFPIEQFVNLAVVIAFLIFWTTAFIILYHLTRFGVGVMPKKLAAIFLIGVVALFSVSLVLFIKVDFTTLLT